MLSPRIPAVFAADEDNSRPINATTGPIAADGSTISIHFVPNFLMIIANKHPQNLPQQIHHMRMDIQICDNDICGSNEGEATS